MSLAYEMPYIPSDRQLHQHQPFTRHMEPPVRSCWKGQLNSASIQAASPLRNLVICLASGAVLLGYCPVEERDLDPLLESSIQCCIIYTDSMIQASLLGT